MRDPRHEQPLDQLVSLRVDVGHASLPSEGSGPNGHP
jgi:hypothetical protein